MAIKKIFRCLMVFATCSMLLIAGCIPKAKETTEPKIKPAEDKPKVTVKEKPKPVVKEDKPTVELALKYAADDSTTYRFTTEAQRSIKWEGPLPKEGAFKGGMTSSKIEMNFTQQIQSVDEKGNAVAQITINALKYLSIIKDNPVIDFDSSRARDKTHSFAKLIGQSYTIELTPAGQVSKVIDVSKAQAALRGAAPADKAALSLLTPNLIKERHTVPAIPVTDKNRLRKGDNWSGVKTFSFGLMGSKSYDRSYILKDVKETAGSRIATIEMKATPTTDNAEQLHKQQTMSNFSKMFDNTETFEGELKLDLTTGKVEKCVEKLQSEWIAIEPSVGPQVDKEPAVLKMTAVRLYSLEKTD